MIYVKILHIKKVYRNSKKTFLFGTTKDNFISYFILECPLIWIKIIKISTFYFIFLMSNKNNEKVPVE